MDNLKISIPESLHFKCNSKACEEAGLLCCKIFNIVVSKSELDGILEIFDEVKKAYNLPTVFTKENFYTEYEPGSFELNHDEGNDACIFLADSPTGQGCALHFYCSSNNIDYRLHKPEACRMFPLESFEENGKLCVIMHEDYKMFPCVIDKQDESSIPLEKILETELI